MHMQLIMSAEFFNKIKSCCKSEHMTYHKFFVFLSLFTLYLLAMAAIFYFISDLEHKTVIRIFVIIQLPYVTAFISIYSYLIRKIKENNPFIGISSVTQSDSDIRFKLSIINSSTRKTITITHIIIGGFRTFSENFTVLPSSSQQEKMIVMPVIKNRKRANDIRVCYRIGNTSKTYDISII